MGYQSAVCLAVLQQRVVVSDDQIYNQIWFAPKNKTVG